MSYSVIKYDKNNKINLEYSNFLNNFVFYKYENEKVIKITINPKLFNNHSFEYCDIYELELLDGFKIGNKKNKVGISKKYIRRTVFDNLGRKVYYRRANLQKGTVFKEKFIYCKEGEFKITDYNKQKDLYYNVSEKKLNNFIKILKNGRK